jgi:RNA polymerase sigma-70 factor (ECF subfamily)
VDDVRVTEASEIERVYREVGDRLWWALLAYTGDREMASDAAAEAFARALAAPATIRDPAAWVWRVAFRVATTLLRTPVAAAGDHEESHEMDDRILDVIRELKRLPHRQRAVFVLFYLEDKPTTEIAEMLGMAPPTVSVHLHRARRKLRAILGGDDA